MQNHLEISSTTYFWIRNVRNLTKSRDLDMSGLAKTCPGGQVLTANQRKYFCFFRFYTFPFSPALTVRHTRVRCCSTLHLPYTSIRLGLVASQAEEHSDVRLQCDVPPLTERAATSEALHRCAPQPWQHGEA